MSDTRPAQITRSANGTSTDNRHGPLAIPAQRGDLCLEFLFGVITAWLLVRRTAACPSAH